MSFQLSALTSVASTALHAALDVAHQAAGGGAAGGAAARASGDDVPFCGTPVPGHPPIPRGIGSLLDAVALNPQPLPPKEVAGGLKGGGLASAFLDDWCGTVPKKIPHFPPPPPGPWADLAAAATGLAR
jgi:hypothetical protein